MVFSAQSRSSDSSNLGRWRSLTQPYSPGGRAGILNLRGAIAWPLTDSWGAPPVAAVEASSVVGAPSGADVETSLVGGCRIYHVSSSSYPKGI